MKIRKFTKTEGCPYNVNEQHIAISKKEEYLHELFK